MKVFKNLMLLIAFAVFCWVGIRYSQKQKEQARIAAIDEQYAKKADAFMEEALNKNPALRGKFGALLDLSGSGYRRPGWALISRIEMDRIAQFQRGKVRVTIVLPRGHPSEDGTQALVMSRWELSTGSDGRHFLEAWLSPETSVTLPPGIPELTITDHSSSGNQFSKGK